MLRLFLVTLLLILPVLPASAEIRSMAAKPGVSELRGACSKAGGQFDVSPDGQGYACTTTNCDGKGGNCTVACDNNNNCTGSTPARIVSPTTLIGILQNGKLVIRDPKTHSTDSQSGPSTGGATGGSEQPPVFVY
jgi:hypothetical protein